MPVHFLDEDVQLGLEIGVELPVSSLATFDCYLEEIYTFGVRFASQGIRFSRHYSGEQILRRQFIGNIVKI